MFGMLKNGFSNMMSNKRLLIILVLSAIFIGVAVYVYMTYVAPKMNPQYIENKEIVEDTGSKSAEIYLFYTEWCPHCKKAKPEWQKFKENYENKTINNYILYFRDVDCEKDEKTADEFNIEGYPTIKLVKDGQVIEYDAKPEYSTLEEFIHTTL